jgi:hypothetical protein
MNSVTLHDVTLKSVKQVAVLVVCKATSHYAAAYDRGIYKNVIMYNLMQIKSKCIVILE